MDYVALPRLSLFGAGSDALVQCGRRLATEMVSFHGRPRSARPCPALSPRASGATNRLRHTLLSPEPRCGRSGDLDVVMETRETNRRQHAHDQTCQHVVFNNQVSVSQSGSRNSSAELNHTLTQPPIDFSSVYLDDTFSSITTPFPRFNPTSSNQSKCLALPPSLRVPSTTAFPALWVWRLRPLRARSLSSPVPVSPSDTSSIPWTVHTSIAGRV